MKPKYILKVAIVLITLLTTIAVSYFFSWWLSEVMENRPFWWELPSLFYLLFAVVVQWGTASEIETL